MTTAARGFCHLNVNICQFWADTTDAVVFLGMTVSSGPHALTHGVLEHAGAKEISDKGFSVKKATTVKKKHDA